MFNVFRRYLVHITKIPFHVFWETWNSYPSFCKCFYWKFSIFPSSSWSGKSIKPFNLLFKYNFTIKRPKMAIIIMVFFPMIFPWFSYDFPTRSPFQALIGALVLGMRHTKWRTGFHCRLPRSWLPPIGFLLLPKKWLFVPKDGLFIFHWRPKVN